MSSQDVIVQILDQARWAPSGDNTQPWRFELLGDRRVRVHGFDTRDHCVYDLDGHPSQISIGALLETAAIAASTYGLRMTATRNPESPEERPVFDLQFTADATIATDPLAACIEKRSVQRRPLRTTALTAAQKQQLEAAAGLDHSIVWLEGFATRLKMAKLLFHSAKLRLVMPEAYRVHKDIIEWQAQFSTERVPDQALGADPMTTRLMQFVMQSWPRVEMFNRFFAGTWAPRIQLDFLPGLACAAHFLLLAPRPADTIDDYVAAGRAMQRFWLSVTDLGLLMQPEVTPLVFSRYARQNIAFSSTPGLGVLAEHINQRLCTLIGTETTMRAVFMGRVGSGAQPSARSLRRELSDLMQPLRQG